MTDADQRPEAQESSGLIIRPYRAEDTATLLALFRSSVRSIAPGNYSAAQIESWAPADLDEKTFAQQLARASTSVAELEGVTVGFSDLHWDGHIERLYVHPEFQRRGVARALLHYLESRAKHLGLRRLYSEVSITARPVFEAAGFKMIVSQTISVRGEEMLNYRMEKRLR
jgi:putative acetyltransferase